MSRGFPPFRVLRRRLLYRGRVVRFTCETLRAPSGQTITREVIHHPRSVVLLPMLPGGRLVMIRQFRAAIGRFIYEIPAGTSEPGEPLGACCRRELAEEIGYRAARYERLCRFFPAPGISTEEMFLYRATGLTPLARPPAQDVDEVIAPHVVSAAEALRMVRRGQVVDAKSIIGLTWGLGAVTFAPGRHPGRERNGAR